MRAAQAGLAGRTDSVLLVPLLLLLLVLALGLVWRVLQLPAVPRPRPRPRAAVPLCFIWAVWTATARRFFSTTPFARI
jgi:hypothetical protein